MKRTALAERPTFTIRDVYAGCFTCGGGEALWSGGQAQGTAARHHDASGHVTWATVAMSVRYGCDALDGAQHDLEDAIAASRSGGEPDAAPLPETDAPAARTADVSAPVSRSSRSALAATSRSMEHV